VHLEEHWTTWHFLLLAVRHVGQLVFGDTHLLTSHYFHSAEEQILSGAGICTLSMAIIAPYLDGIPNICIELLFFLLAARVFVEHLLEMKRACPNWGFDGCLSILFRDHLLHFTL